MNRLARQRIASLYDGRLQRCYVRTKLASDPVYAAVTALVAGSALPLLDIGCGIGLLGQYLHAHGHALPYLGVDHDPRKIAAGRRAVQRAGLAATMGLHRADVTELPPTRGHVALLDVLHYLPAGRQRECCRPPPGTSRRRAAWSSAMCCARTTGASMPPGSRSSSCPAPAGFPAASSTIRQPPKCAQP